jgi:putative peptidoglycan lipid II flippase
MREVAAAMSHAHRMGLPHRRLAPDTVVVTRSSGVKLIGLGTFAAVRPEDDENKPVDAERQDTLDLGRLLYACLTARWPGGATAGLPAAPTEHGRLLRPRQVRAGVPRPLDVVCDRILADPPRYGRPITTVDEVHDALSGILTEEGVTAVGTVGMTPTTNPTPPATEPPPALLLRDESGPVTGNQPAYAGSSPRGASSTLGRTLLLAIVAVLVLGAMLLAYLVAQQGRNGGTAANGVHSPSPSGNVAALKPVTITGGQDFDPPPGSGEENPSEVRNAFDGKPTTTWQTMTYFDPLAEQKPGVGLIVDLGRTQDVSKVDVRLVGSPTDLELRAAPPAATTAPTGSVDDYSLVQKITDAGTLATFEPAQPVRTRFLLVWLTKLPEETDGFKGQIAEIKAYG